MKNALLVLSFLLLFTISAKSQTIRFLSDPNAELVGLFPATLGIGLDENGHPFSSKAGAAGGQVEFVIGGWRTQSGKIEYQMISDSIRYNGPSHIIDNTPTSTLYAFLAQEAVFQGILHGFTPTPECSTPWSTNVYAESCVVRMGTGCYTRFVPCDRTTYSTWRYGVCRDQENSEVKIARIPFSNPINCDGACEPTCPTGGNSSAIQ